MALANDLSKRQRAFAKALAALIAFACAEGYEIKICELWRDTATQTRYVAEGKSKTMSSKHLLGLAADVALFLNDKYIPDGPHYRALGEFWESLGGRWGGRFGVKPEEYAAKLGWDVVHFEWS